MSPEGAEVPDAVLVAAVLAGDREAFAAVYDRYADRLHDFAHSLLRHREEAADSVADAFVIMAERLEQLREPELLRPWLYSVVRHECLRRIRARDRQAFEAEDRLTAMAEQEPGPSERAEQASLRALLEDAATGLNERDRTVLDLHLRHGLDGAELGAAIGESPERTYTLMNRLREQVGRSLGALLVARQGRRDCPGLEDVLQDWDGLFNPLIRKRVARHVDGCLVCERRRALLVAPGALLSVAPLVGAPLALRDRVLDDPRLVGFWSNSPSSTLAHPSASPELEVAQESHRRSGALVRSATAAVVLLVLGGLLALVWPFSTNDPELSEGSPALQETGETTTGLSAAAPPTSLTPFVPTATAEAQPTQKRTPRPGASPEATSEAPPAPTPSPTPQPPATPQPSPGSLSVSTRLLDLGQDTSRARLTLTNTGGRALDFALAPQATWVTAAPGAGSLAPGASQQVLVEVARGALDEGEAATRVQVTWSGPTIPVHVRVSTARAPAVGPVVVTHATSGSCTARFLVVTARVVDESDLDAVRLAWSGDASGSAPMSIGGQGWTTQIGPFPPGAQLVAEVRATDVHGAVGTASHRFVVEPCPG